MRGAARSSILPIVDISDVGAGDPTAKQRASAALGRAFADIGFVIVTGHGIDDALIEATYTAAKRFFGLALAEKMTYALPDRAMDCGYLPVGIETVAATLGAQTPADLCEALVFRSLAQEARQPPEIEGGWRNRWPTQPPEFAGLVRAYFAAVDDLALRLRGLSALALDLPEQYFAAFHADGGSTLRFVNYPDQLAQPEPGQLRYGAHHDYGGLTIVRTDAAAGGLQVCTRAGAWHDVPVVPGGFVVNIGELLERWTNGRWCSTLHRVVNPPRDATGSTQRLSLVLFTGPDADAEIACLPTCCDATRPARYAPVTAGEFIAAKLERSVARGAESPA